MIDYTKEREKYRPKNITTLLIGEAPPPSGKTYFYLPKEMNNVRSIEKDTSLPATIFNHYFGKRPEGITEYEVLLNQLKMKGIFLIDILDEPLRIRGNKENEKYLISKIPELKSNIKKTGITLPEKNWIFLLARSSYKKWINIHFPDAQKIRWIDFRLNPIQ